MTEEDDSLGGTRFLTNPGDEGTTGILTIMGNYMQTADGKLNIRIGGNDAGSGYDQLVILGQAQVDGALSVQLLNGFVPPSGSAFKIISFLSGGGAFADTSGVDSRFFVLPPIFGPTDVTLMAS